jgi:hypothetical protein
MPSGTYKIRVAAPGFSTSEADNVILRVAQTLTINLTLEIGEVSEQVTVSDKPPLLESGTAEIGAAHYVNAVRTGSRASRGASDRRLVDVYDKVLVSR